MDSIRVTSYTDQNWVDGKSYHSFDLPGTDNKLSIGIVSDITIGYRGLSLDQISLMYDPIYDCLKGDLNHDGYLLITDIVVLLDLVINNLTPTGFQYCSGDKRIDENLDILDIISILNEILGE